MVLPIVSRELLVRSRSHTTHYLRVGAALVILLMGIGLMVQTRATPSGGFLIILTSWLLFLFCAVEGVRNAGMAIAVERQERTLGLLFLTDLNGLDVLLGKLAAASLGTLYALMAMIPLTFVATLVGGVTAGELIRLTAALLSCLALSLAAGGWASVRSAEPMSAMARAFALFMLVCLAPLAVFQAARFFWSSDPNGSHLKWIERISPLASVDAIRDTGTGTHSLHFWCGITVQILVAWAVIRRASKDLSTRWQDQEKFCEGFTPVSDFNQNGRAKFRGLHRSLMQQLQLNRWGWVLCVAPMIRLLPNFAFTLSGPRGSSSYFLYLFAPTSLIALAAWFLSIYLPARFFLRRSPARRDRVVADLRLIRSRVCSIGLGRD